MWCLIRETDPRFRRELQPPGATACLDGERRVNSDTSTFINISEVHDYDEHVPRTELTRTRGRVHTDGPVISEQCLRPHEMHSLNYVPTLRL